jgi:hypothetical protein
VMAVGSRPTGAHDEGASENSGRWGRRAGLLDCHLESMARTGCDRTVEDRCRQSKNAFIDTLTARGFERA